MTMTPTMPEAFRALILRELRGTQREIEQYPNDESVWAMPPGIKNSAGNLALHLAGNLQHFVGARLGGSSYVRDREAEFSQRHLSRAELVRELGRAIESIEKGFSKIKEKDLAAAFPDQVAGVSPGTGEFLLHIAVHLGYHLGQIDYHRRLVTGDATTVDTVSVKELPSAGVQRTA
jgi:uncharacterized protein DUF1572